MESRGGSTFIVFSLPMDIYITLLSALGNSKLQMQLDQHLQRALPERCWAMFRLGGLPPIEVMTCSKVTLVITKSDLILSCKYHNSF